MKLKPVKNMKELKAGAYIRALILPSGIPFCEYIEITGRPFVQRSIAFPEGTWVVNVKQEQYPHGAHLTDLGVNKSRSPYAARARLFPFAPKIWDYLKNLNVHDFSNVILNN